MQVREGGKSVVEFGTWAAPDRNLAPVLPGANLQHAAHVRRAWCPVTCTLPYPSPLLASPAPTCSLSSSSAFRFESVNRVAAVVSSELPNAAWRACRRPGAPRTRTPTLACWLVAPGCALTSLWLPSDL